ESCGRYCANHEPSNNRSFNSSSKHRAFSLSSCCSLLTSHCSLSFDHPIRPRQHVGWDREADLLGGFQIDDKLKLRRSLNRQVTGLGTFKYFVHKVCAAPK